MTFQLLKRLIILHCALKNTQRSWRITIRKQFCICPIIYDRTCRSLQAPITREVVHKSRLHFKMLVRGQNPHFLSHRPFASETTRPGARHSERLQAPVQDTILDLFIFFLGFFEMEPWFPITTKYIIKPERSFEKYIYWVPMRTLGQLSIFNCLTGDLFNR